MRLFTVYCDFKNFITSRMTDRTCARLHFVHLINWLIYNEDKTPETTNLLILFLADMTTCFCLYKKHLTVK